MIKALDEIIFRPVYTNFYLTICIKISKMAQFTFSNYIHVHLDLRGTRN